MSSSEEAGIKCPYCGEELAFYNLVDITNGFFRGNKRIEGYIEPKVIKSL